MTPFWKYSALGNTFVVLPASRPARARRLAWIARLCSERTGIGADGAVLVHAASRSLAIYNADGSRASLSGNGARCAAAWWFETRSLRVSQVIWQTDAGRILCRQRGRQVEVRIPPPAFESAAIPAQTREPEVWRQTLILGRRLGRVRVCALSVGNPQCVIWGRYHPRNWREVGQALESHALFPDNTNVVFVRKDGNALDLRIWERGVGETDSSGTGAAAAAVVGVRLGRSPRRTQARMPGGTMNVHWLAGDEITLTCPVEPVAAGTWRGTGAP